MPTFERLWNKYFTAAPERRRRCVGRSGIVKKASRALATRYDINLKTFAKWRKRASVEDAAMGPAPRSLSLTPEQEAVVVAFRKHTLLPLDDCLYSL